MKPFGSAMLAMSIFFIIGCVHTSQTCTIAGTHSPTELHICMGGKEVQEGDRVAFYKTKCTTPSRGTPKKCIKTKVGEGSIVNILDEHLSTVKLDSEFKVDEQTLVEKQQKN